MLPESLKLLAGRVAMKPQVELDRDEPFYTDHDAISGKVVLTPESPLSLLTIKVVLSGVSVSRLQFGGSIEVHQLLRKSETVFPPKIPIWSSHHTNLTIGAGRHVLPFSITVPQVSECYKTRIDGSLFRSHRTQSRKAHLLQKLPPSCGETGAAGEVKYSLEVVFEGAGVPRGCRTLNRDIYLFPLSQSMPLQQPFQKQRCVSVVPAIHHTTAPLSWQIDVELINGPRLVSRQPIPLLVRLTKLCEDHSTIHLNDFQTTLVETTRVCAKGSTRSVQQSWIVQTVSNLRQRVLARDAPFGTVADLPGSVWASYPIPSAIVPSFEICNIKRTYQLKVRLGLKIDLFKPRVVIREFQFPVYLMVTDPVICQPTSPMPPSPSNTQSPN